MSSKEASTFSVTYDNTRRNSIINTKYQDNHESEINELKKNLKEKDEKINDLASKLERAIALVEATTAQKE